MRQEKKKEKRSSLAKKKRLDRKKDKQEEERNKDGPGTFEVMGSEGERERKGNEDLIWRYRRHMAIPG